MAEIYFIAAIDEHNGLAKNGKLPWDLPDDRAFFREKVKDGPVVMGQKTFESNNNHSFGQGKNYILSRTKQNYPGVQYVQTIQEVLTQEAGVIWVIGGGQIFSLLIKQASKLYVTRVEGDFACDVFFPEFETAFHCVEQSPWHEQNGIHFRYEVYERATSE